MWDEVEIKATLQRALEEIVGKTSFYPSLRTIFQLLGGVDNPVLAQAVVRLQRALGESLMDWANNPERTRDEFIRLIRLTIRTYPTR